MSLIPGDDRGFRLAAQMDITLPQADGPQRAARIVAAADLVYPYSNATRGYIEVRLTANGRPVG